MKYIHFYVLFTSPLHARLSNVSINIAHTKKREPSVQKTCIAVAQNLTRTIAVVQNQLGVKLI